MTFDNLPRVDKTPDPFSNVDSRLRDPKRLEAHATSKTVEQSNRAGVRVYLSANQNINNNVGGGNNITWDLESFDIGGFHSGSSDQLVIPDGKTTGLWHLKTRIRWSANATGTRNVVLSSNLATLASSTLPGLSGTVEQDMELSTLFYDPVPGTYFTVNVYQNSGVALNIIGGASYTSYFELIHLW